MTHDPVRNGRRSGMDALALAPGTRYAREGRFAGDGPRDPALDCFGGRGIYARRGSSNHPFDQHHQKPS